ncbi:diacylglycerol kinase family protein [Patescibacteria group bacterium AH-259-L07]|nr:diacylglycerol kinase family protein [Patescibacteria group bacterium AH-259-L07]
MPIEKDNRNTSWFQRLIKRFLFALHGFRAAWRIEQSFRIQVVSALIIVILGIVVRLTSFEWMFIIVAIGAVLSLELLNSMIEKVLDILHPEARERVKIIKDISAAAVLIAALMAIGIGLIVFIPYLY